jgi:hypothetical protein
VAWPPPREVLDESRERRLEAERSSAISDMLGAEWEAGRPSCGAGACRRRSCCSPYVSASEPCQQLLGGGVGRFSGR